MYNMPSTTTVFTTKGWEGVRKRSVTMNTRWQLSSRQCSNSVRVTCRSPVSSGILTVPGNPSPHCTVLSRLHSSIVMYTRAVINPQYYWGSRSSITLQSLLTYPYQGRTTPTSLVIQGLPLTLKPHFILWQLSCCQLSNWITGKRGNLCDRTFRATG